jgi:uncharacterized peroxidase-related enzyme
LNYEIMKRITPIDPAQATGKAKELLDGVQAKLGATPNLYRVFAHSPAAFAGFLNFGQALANGVLNPKVREQIALAVAEINDCDYCRSAHTFVGGKVGLTEREIADARLATAGDARVTAILNLARSLVVQRGELSDAEFQAARSAGLTDAEIIETLANVALNIFTNYTNHVARTVVDFPAAKPLETVPAGETCGTAGCGCGH